MDRFLLFLQRFFFLIFLSLIFFPNNFPPFVSFYTVEYFAITESFQLVSTSTPINILWPNFLSCLQALTSNIFKSNTQWYIGKKNYGYMHFLNMRLKNILLTSFNIYLQTFTQPFFITVLFNFWQYSYCYIILLLYIV